MLVECLSVGHGITLPSNLTSGVKSVALGIGSYAHIRRQFKVPIGKMESIEEPLSRIADNTYVMDTATSLITYSIMLGGSLKRRERISARLGDVLSQLFLACAVLKRYNEEDHPEEDLPLLHWGVQNALYQAEQAMVDLLQNFPNHFNRKHTKLPDWAPLPCAVRPSES